MTLTVAITGGIGAGKSTFSNEVLKKKLKLFDSDKQVHKIYKTPKKNFLEPDVAAFTSAFRCSSLFKIGKQ